MNINERYLSLENQGCKNCRNNSICKWIGEKTRIDNELSKIERTPLSPIIFNSNCKNYEKQTQKQDGLYFR